MIENFFGAAARDTIARHVWASVLISQSISFIFRSSFTEAERTRFYGNWAVFCNNYCKQLLSIVILSSSFVLSMVYFLSNRRVRIVNNFPGVEFLWRYYDALYLDFSGVHAAGARDSRLCGLVLMGTPI